MPKSWVETTTEEGKVGWWREHEHGGHFAALEGPGVLWGDLREFVEEVVVGGVLICVCADRDEKLESARWSFNRIFLELF